MPDDIQTLVQDAQQLAPSPQLAQQILSLIDLTSLNDNDTSATITALCQKAMLSTGKVAAVCVYPQFVTQASKLLAGTTVNIATVANFPQGTATVDEVVPAIRQAISAGAQEIDVVFPYQRYLSGDKSGAQEFIRACKTACGTVLLKVILETGFYQDYQVMAEIAEAAVVNGADFLKTSTGKIATGATPEAAAVLLSVIKNLQPAVPRRLGFKAAGGIRTIPQAASYLALANHILGPTWATPATFRLGASQLMDVLLMAL